MLILNVNGSKSNGKAISPYLTGFLDWSGQAALFPAST